MVGQKKKKAHSKAIEQCEKWERVQERKCNKKETTRDVTR